MKKPKKTCALAFARELAVQTGLELPEAAVKDRVACKAFIDKAMSKRKPTEAMLKLAVKLAGEAGEPLPDDVAGNFEKCRRYIDRHFKKGGRK